MHDLTTVNLEPPFAWATHRFTFDHHLHMQAVAPDLQKQLAQRWDAAVRSGTPGPLMPLLSKRTTSPGTAGTPPAPASAAEPGNALTPVPVRGPAEAENDFAKALGNAAGALVAAREGLARLAQSLPPAAREFLLKLLSSQSATEAHRLLLLLQQAVADGAAAAGQQQGLITILSLLVRSSQAQAPGAGMLGSAGATGAVVGSQHGGDPVLYPAGRLLHIVRMHGNQLPVQGAGLPSLHNGSSYAVVELSREASYFRRAIVSPSALRQHRSSAYRDALQAAIDRLPASEAS